MRNPQGYGVVFGPSGVIDEHDTTTCGHCNGVNKIIHGMRAEDMGGLCKLCMKLTCSKCVDGPCIPFEKKLEQMEARDRWHRAYNV